MLARSLTATLTLLAALGGAGCVTVKPWQREQLASTEMQAPFARPATGVHRDKVMQTRTGGGLPGAVPGGGCGCTQ